MRTVNINGSSAVVVGHFYFYDGDVGNRISTAFNGATAAKMLEDAFNNNDAEDYATLAQHPDPQVRLLVARNFQELDLLTNDKDTAVKETAEFIHSVALPVKTYQVS